MKRIVSGLICMLVILFLITPVPASATSALYICSIDSVAVTCPIQVNVDKYYVFILTDTNGSFTEQAFRIERADSNNPILSVFLTASGSGLPVKVFLDPADPDSLVEAHVVRP